MATWCPELIRNFCLFLGHLDCGEKPLSLTVTDPASKVDEDTLLCFLEPAFLLDGTWQQHSPDLLTHHTGTQERALA